MTEKIRKAIKLLPKKIDIDKAKALEKKQEIDNGMSLAKSVDKLREQLATEKNNLLQWRETNLSKVRQEIDSYLEVKENLRIETEKAEAHRRKLIEPLDNEWAELIKEKLFLDRLKKEITSEKENWEKVRNEIESERNKVSKIVSRVTQNEQDTEKEKLEALSLKELAHKEYEIAREEHTTQTNTYERKLSDLDKREREFSEEQSRREKQYDDLLASIAIREKKVETKESEIINKEKNLEAQQISLTVAREVIKKHGNSMSTNN